MNDPRHRVRISMGTLAAAAALVACGNLHRYPVGGAAPDAASPPPADAAEPGPLPPDGSGSPPSDGAAAGEAGPTAATDGGRSSATWFPCGRLGHGGPAAVAISARGNRVAFAFAYGGAVQVREFEQREVLLEIAPPWPLKMPRVFLSDDGALAAVQATRSGADSRLGVWRVDSGAPLLDLAHTSGAPSFSADGKQVLAIVSGTAQLFSLEDGSRLRDYGKAVSAALGKSGEVVVYDAAGASDGVTRRYLAEQPPVVRPFPFGPDAVLSRRGTYLAGHGAPAGGLLDWRLYQVASGKLLPPRFIGSATFFSEDEAAVLSSNDLSGAMFETATGNELSLPAGLAVSRGSYQDVALGPGGKAALVASVGGVVESGAADVPEGILVETGAGTGAPVVSIAASANGRWLVTGSSGTGRDVVVWDLPARSQLSLRAAAPVTGLTFAGDSVRFAGTAGGGVMEWGLELTYAYWSPQMGNVNVESGGQAWMAAYAPDWGRTALTYFDAPISIINRGSNDQPIKIVTTDRQVGVAFSPDGRSLATSEPSVIDPAGHRVWSHGQPFPSQKDLNYSENWAAVSPDGATMVVSRFLRWQSVPWIAASPDSSDYLTETRLYRTEDGVLLRELGSLPRRPVFSPDGAWIAAGDKLYDVAGDRMVLLPRDPALGAIGIDSSWGAVATFVDSSRVAVGNAWGIIEFYCAAP
jgi:WD40 repeat protein